MRGAELVSLFLSGLLAGEELVIRYGVRDPLNVLSSEPQIQFRKALILRLRILVPVLFVLTAFSAVAVLVVERTAPGTGFRWAGGLALVVFIAVTLGGTVPINKALLDWRPEAPPSDWQARIRRWEQLDSVRCWAAVSSFAAFLAASGLTSAG